MTKVQQCGHPGLLWLACTLVAMGFSPMRTEGATETVVHNFAAPARGAAPYGGVIGDSAGNLFGTASSGGASGAGVVYKISPTGAETVLHSFTGRAGGGNPQTGVVLDAAGNLYGTASTGGVSGVGVVFKLSPTGAETVLYNFKPGAGGFGGPSSGVTLDSVGNLYGMGIGGTFGAGFVFKLDTTGKETMLYSFTGGADGSSPSGGLILDAVGNLYGTTVGGGASGAGVVFMLSPTGAESVLYSFKGGADAGSPYGGVIRDSSGNLYGTTPNGGTFSAGTVFKLDSANKETLLYSFTGGVDGGDPYAGVIRDSSGNLYGTTARGGVSAAPCSPSGCGVVFKLTSTGSETVLHSFTDGPFSYPYPSGVIRDSAGDMFGTTPSGGLAREGVVFKLSTGGQETILLDFPGRDGFYPTAGVIRDSAGDLSGTTFDGGPSNAGTVFQVSATGREKVLYSFTGGVDGFHPQAGVISDSIGNLFGTTVNGGTSGHGVIFKVSPTGAETVLHSFTGGADGGEPIAGVISDAAGNLYGTTAGGGGSNAGVVYKLDTSGKETVLYNFTGGADGANPWTGVIRDSAGNLYGTTFGSGPSGGGVVYKLDTTGKETVLYSFAFFAVGFGQTTGVILDSANNLYGTDAVHGTVFKIDAAGNVKVLATLTGVGFGASIDARDSTGNLYGTSGAGGKGSCYSSGGPGCGVLFKLDTSNKEIVLYSFTGAADGGIPNRVILDSTGNLYGTTYSGGSQNRGVVFELKP